MRLALTLTGELQARAVAAGQAVEFVDAAGCGVLRYDHLAVRDARGQALTARMWPQGQELRLEVEDAAAVYPVTIDPIFAQQAYLKASNTGGGASDEFGYSVAVSGDTVVVGAVGEASNATGVNGNQADNSAPASGAAYVFVRSGTTWSQQAYLKASNTGADDYFGWSLAVAGDTVVVGAFGDSSNATGVNGNQADNSASASGAAYVFVRSGTTWSQQAYLKASNTGLGDNFGDAVAVAGDTVVVGARHEASNATGVNGNQADNSATDSGAVYVFVRSGTAWSQQAYLKASNTGLGDNFGNAVAVAGDTVVVGARHEASNATGVNGNQADNSALISGAAYVFVRSAGVWSQQAYLKASNTGGSDRFGYSVAVAGDTVVVGAGYEDSNATGVNGNQADNSASNAGAAYVFVRSGTTWSQQAYLKASNTGMFDLFGVSVAVSGDTVVVGAFFEASNATGVNGNQADNSASYSGAAYVFVRSGTTWSQQAYLKASNTGGGAGDFFGSSVAVSGDTVVVVASGESSNATGVNGNQADNSAPASGAAYVFVRSGTTWSQQAYLKASNTGAGDYFGKSVAVSGDTLVVAAFQEDSNATGVNGNQADNSATDSGAAYVFVRSGTTWSQQAYLKASNTGAGDLFGLSVAVSGDTVVVGAYGESSNATGVNGNQADNSAFNAGAAYVFVRSGTTWSQQAYLKASNTEGGDIFGYTVSVSGDTVVVGASQEDSNATGVNGNQADNSATQAGAVYVFILSTNTAPTITAGGPLARQQGSPGTVGTIATVGDVETPAASLIVTATTIPTGITITGITNTNGTVTANVAAGCNATPGANTVVLTVTDGGGALSTANLTVNVSANAAPTLSYNNASVLLGGSTTINPATGPNDNGSIASITLLSQGTYTGTISVNNSTGVVSLSNATPAGAHTITVRATDNCGGMAFATFTLTVNCPGVTVNPANQTLPAGTAGQPYSQQFTQTGGTGAITWSVSTGALPTNLTLNSTTGLLAGTPTGFGTFNFTIKATAANGCMGTQVYTLVINPPCGTITVNPATLANGFVGTAYNQTLTAIGGTAPYTFTVSAGTLPGGLTLNASTGALTGTPTTQNTFSFTIKATDANSCMGTRQYTVIISGNGLMFYPLAAPVRLLDTRPGASPNACSQPNLPIAGQTSRTQPGRSLCMIPANAVALTGNITTVNSGGGFLTLYPSNAAQPTVASTNYGVNEIINNVFTVGLGADGAFKIFANNTTDVVVDVSGYYAPPATNGLFFHPLPAPVRLLETRASFTGCVTPSAPLTGNADSTQQAISACTGIPAAARAIVGNATTVGPQGGGFLTIFPADAARPLVAASNFNTGQIVNGPFAVGLAPNGQFKIYTTSTTDLVVDVLGYYSTEVLDANGAGLLLTPLAHPVRLLETRAGQPVGCVKPGAPLNGGQIYTQTARGLCDGLTIPAAALGVVGNATVVFPVSGGYLTLWPSSAAQPTVATANYKGGDVVNRHFIVGLGNADGAFKMFSSATTELVIDLSGYFAP